ncbi:unnamed protein product [Pleuronectes platessa]|uniref:Uncharacterized protein n=1 Tax=Pleuronectes platessa TaxID=8262 RepID=A0A9N7UGZ9_PLEPL|nr:unnamed protein product [Pleuronectes platessa]
MANQSNKAADDLPQLDVLDPPAESRPYASLSRLMELKNRFFQHEPRFLLLILLLRDLKDPVRKLRQLCKSQVRIHTIINRAYMRLLYWDLQDQKYPKILVLEAFSFCRGFVDELKQIHCCLAGGQSGQLSSPRCDYLP